MLILMPSRHEANALAYEWLLRGLLELPKSPAVVNLHVSLSARYGSLHADSSLSPDHRSKL